jgi:hypothetical protein
MAQRGGIYVQGEVLERTFRQGVTNGREWSFHSLAILTGTSTTEVTWQQDSEGEVPNEGQTVSLLVNVRGSRISARRHATPPALVAKPAA